MYFPTSKTLESPRCRFRYISRSDLQHIIRVAKHTGFTDGMSWEPPEHEHELIEHHESCVKAWSNNLAYVFTIETKLSEEFIGRISIRKEEGKGRFSLGFWADPNKQKRGYMTEAVKTLLDFGFRELDASEIVASHAVWNKKSEKVIKNNGMTFIKHDPKGFKKKGKWVKVNLLGITKNEWHRKTLD